MRDAFDTNRVMTFHPPVAKAVGKRWTDAELLYGKPMPAALARQLLAEKPELATQIVWLIDTPERLAQYAEIAGVLGRQINFCFEVDVGLHRGGLSSPDALTLALAQLRQWPLLRCHGIMAYEAHIGHIPGFLGGPEKARARSIALFQAFVARLGEDQRRILNLGGSTTALTYDAEVGANEISIGSAFVKPTDFDVPSLAALQPAIFIAAPVLKVVDVQLPGLDAKSGAAQSLGLLPKRGIYVYGGKWMARPEHPAGMRVNTTIGQSTNQQFFALPDDARISPDDFAFFRPTQSEFVLQQFGAIRVYAGGKIMDEWPVLPLG